MMRKHRVTSLVVACVVLPVFLWLFTTVGIAASQLSVSVWTDKTQYQIGEQVVIKFKVNKVCNAKLTILKPNGGVVTWGPKTIPAATVSVKSTAGSPTGQRTVTVEASLASEYKKAVTTFIVGSGGGPGPGPSPGPGPGPWQIVAKHSGKCLDVSGAGKNSGDNVHQWDCHNGDHQRWELKPAGGNYYQLVAKHSGKCLDVSGAGKNSGDNVQQWDCHNGACQQWELKPAGGNYYQLVAKHSGKCLTVSGGGYDNGRNVYQWECHTGDQQRWELRPVQGSSGSAPGDPFAGPIVAGNWKSIRASRMLIYLGGDRVLDWEPVSGDYRIWRYDRSTSGDPFAGPVVAGNWQSIRMLHILNYLGGDRVLDREPASGDYRIWRYDRSITQGDPFPGSPVVQGNWQSIRAGHYLVYLGGDRVLDWQPPSGNYRIWRYDRSITQGDPFPGSPVVQGNWQSIRASHELVYLEQNRVLDWEPASGNYRIWRYDRTTSGDPFVGPLMQGTWQSIRTGHVLIYLGGNRVLDWDHTSGDYRIWNVVIPS